VTIPPSADGRFAPANRDFAGRVRSSYERQTFMAAIGCRLVSVAAGAVELELPFRADLTQQHGYVHAGVITAIVDTACGCAAFTLLPADAAILSVEFKINLLAPAAGERFVARGLVLRPGRTLTVCSGEVVAFADGQPTVVASMLATMMALPDRAGRRG
jgi:uncharacterized protein (TIGR00369 family)